VTPSLVALAALIGIGLLGCSKSETTTPPDSMAPAASPEQTHPSAPSSAGTSAPLDPLTEEDLEPEVERRITEENLESELDRLEREIQGD
jgi:hypothetical protein